MATSGTHPAFVHAFERCGYLVTEENAHLFPRCDIEAWDAAVAEGERLYGPIDAQQPGPPEGRPG